MSGRPRRRRALTDRRWLGLAVTVVGIALGGQLLYSITDNGRTGSPSTPVTTRVDLPPQAAPAQPGETQREAPPPVASHASPSSHATSARLRELDARFRQGIAMLQRGQFEHAFTAFHRVLEIEPDLVDAHVNIGFALLGMRRHAEALEFFIGATELKPDQANAYYGMGLSLEGLGQLQSALEAMETYLHLEKTPSEHTRRADSATWEWRYRIAGLPLTEEELKAELRRRAANGGEDERGRSGGEESPQS